MKAGSEPVASPCNNVCRIDEASGWCLGCWRTIDEIARWAQAGDDERRAVLGALPGRRRQRGPAAPVAPCGTPGEAR